MLANQTCRRKPYFPGPPKRFARTATKDESSKRAPSTAADCKIGPPDFPHSLGKEDVMIEKNTPPISDSITIVVSERLGKSKLFLDPIGFNLVCRL